MTPQKMREYLESAPAMMDGEPIAERSEDLGAGYELSARTMARAFLELCEENPSLLDVPSRNEDPSGMKAAFNDKLWDAFKRKWPEGDNWLGGTTGFQYGWAHSAVRFVLGKEQVGNPAVVTVEVKDDAKA